MSKLAFPKPRKKKPRPRRFGSSLPVGEKKRSKPRKPLKKVNPEREAKRRASYRAKLAAYKKSETYKAVEARAQGQCERRVKLASVPGMHDAFIRCERTRADGFRMTHNHKTYARFGGNERPEDVELLCDVHNDEYESQHSTRSRNYGRAK